MKCDDCGYLVPCANYDGSSQVEPCCICRKPAIENYDDREDCPSCGSLRCNLQIQAALDYHEERGSSY